MAREVLPLARLVLTRRGAGCVREFPDAVEREEEVVVTDPLFDLEGRVAVVTGGMGQLGTVYVSGLADRGMRVAVFDVAAGDVPDGARAYAVDVTDRAAIEDALREVEVEWGSRTCSSTTPPSTHRRTPPPRRSARSRPTRRRPSRRCSTST